MREHTTSERARTFHGARSLMLALASVLTTVSATPAESYQPPVALGRRLRRSNYLGPGGFALLLLRDVRSGSKWHDEARLDHREALDEALPAVLGAIECPLLPALRPGQWSRAQMERVASLKEWWQRARSGAVATERLRGVIVRGETHYWVRSDGEYVVAQRNLSARAAQIPGLKKASSKSRGRERTDVVAAWSAFRDDESGRLCIDVETDEGGLCTGALLLETDRASRQDPKDFFDAVTVSAWDVARIAARQYWILWDRVHSHALLSAINQRASGPDITSSEYAAVHRHDALFTRVAPTIDDLLRTVAYAFQTPSVALLVPDTAGNIGLVSHVGYREPGSPFRLSQDYRGLTHLFCLRINPVTDLHRPAALQLATFSEVDKAYRDFNLGELRSKASQDDPRTETDQRLQHSLYNERVSGERSPRVLRGPWAYANVLLDRSFWNEPLAVRGVLPSPAALSGYGLQAGPKDRPSGVLKIQGRIPCELDRPRASPRLSAIELRRLHLWASTIAQVFHRLLRTHERGMATAIVQDAVPHLAAADLRSFATFLVHRLKAAGVALFVRDEASFKPLMLVWNEPSRLTGMSVDDIAEALCRREVKDVSGDTLVVPDGEILRGFVQDRLNASSAAARMNCVWVPIATLGALAVVGAPPELPAPRSIHAASPESASAAWLAERSRAFPRFLDSTLIMLCHLLHVRMARVTPLFAPPNAGPPDTQRSAGRTQAALQRVWTNIVSYWKGDRRAGPDDPLGRALAQWISRAKSSWPRKEECAKALGRSEETFGRELNQLKAAQVIVGSWREIESGDPFTDDEEAVRALEPIGSRFRGSSEAPPAPSEGRRDA